VKVRIGAAMAGLIGEFERATDRRTARQQAFDQFRWRRLSRFVRGKGRGGENTSQRKPNTRYV